MTDLQSWSRGEWMRRVALVFLLHLLVFYYCSQPGSGRSGSRVGGPSGLIVLGSGGWSDGVLEASLAWSDPTLFALAHPRGFSGSAWRQMPSLKYGLSSWSEPPHLFEPELGDWATEFGQFVEQTVSLPLAVPQRWAPDLPIPAVAPEMVKTSSSWRVDGGLAGRGLVGLPVLPVWPSREVLLPTVVRLMVGAGGEVLSVVPVWGSGSKEADQAALRLALGVRFAAREGMGWDSSGGGPVEFGQMVFEWATMPPPGTNAAATASAR